MITQLEIEQETAQRLKEHAESRHMSVDALLKTILDGIENGTEAAQTAVIPLADFDRYLDELAVGPDTIPALPADFSRADIYRDHD